jgi:site-specific recombinase XerC
LTRSALKLIDPTSEKRTVVRRPNADLRTREHLTDAEVERLMVAARSNRWGHRDATMILVAYRHGLRVSELVGPRAATSSPIAAWILGRSRDRDIQHTVRYTELAPGRFKDFWRD